MYTSSIQIDGKLKSVEDYLGEIIGMPLGVSELEKAIDRLSEAERWTTGNAETVACLKGEEWNFKSKGSADTLVRLARRGSVQVVQDFVAAGTPLNGKDEAGQTALMVAAYRGDVEILRVLLVAGAAKQDSSGFGTDGRTLLMTAAVSGVPSVVEDVLKNHRDVNAQDKQGRTALMEAVGQYHFGPESPEIHRAEVVRLLLQAGADPNLSDENGNTALIETAWDADAALLLIRAGSNLNAQNNKGITPLMNCAGPEVVRVLLAHGADRSIRDADGQTALESAKERGMKDKVAALSTKDH